MVQRGAALSPTDAAARPLPLRRVYFLEAGDGPVRIIPFPGAEPAGAASFALWRLLWIPPFPDGNGRVARAVCHLVVRTACDRYPPVNLVLDPLSADRPPYLAALEAAHCEHRHSGAVPEMGALRTLVAEAMRAT